MQSLNEEIVRIKKLMNINEDYKKSLISAAMVCSLIGGVVSCKGKDTKTEYAVNGIDLGKSVQKLSDNGIQKDTVLTDILAEIKANLTSNNPSKLISLNNKLMSYVQSKGVKIENKEVNLDESGIKGMGITEIFGWLGSLLLALCGVPQAIQSYKDKHSDGISWGFLLLWAFGELFAMVYVGEKVDLPLLLNYATNILIVGVMLYYKVYPKREIDKI